jgi:mono/diheme cytochrome c family protein
MTFLTMKLIGQLPLQSLKKLKKQLKRQVKMKFHSMKKNSLICLLSMVLALSVNVNFAQDGKALFGANCASCHKIDKESTGPALQGARARWEAAGEGELIIDWVKDNGALRASGKSKRAIQVFNDYKGAAMQAFPALTNDEINAILDYADAYTPPVSVAVDAAPGAAGEKNSEGGNLTLWLVLLAVVLVVVFFAAQGVRKKIEYVSNAQAGLPTEDNRTAGEKFGAWILKNWLFSLIIFVAILFMFLADGMVRLSSIGVWDDYQPSQPIEYSHKQHAGDMGIDCRYCHNSVEKSKHAGIPSTNVCMNCHAQVVEGAKFGKTEIGKLHAAAGYNADTKTYNIDSITGKVIEGTPIVWNKVHNLPDHVYFNHKQHVKVGGIDCKQCHGDVATYGLGRISTTEEINALAATDKTLVPLTKPILTMGWCIECHNKKQIDLTSSGYYEEIHKRLTLRPDVYKKISEDGEITVKELGGWECAKCHY